MTDVHKKIHAAKTKNATESALSNKPSAFDPIKPVADLITEDSWLICFDEFQVINFFFSFHMRSNAVIEKPLNAKI